MKTKDILSLPVISAVKRLLYFVSFILITSCASDEALFAKYDQLCRTELCLAPAAEVIYQVEIDAVPWEPAVYFGYDLDALEQTEYNRIDQNIEVLKANPELKVSLQAFTDTNNTVAYNLDLSNRRRITVEDYLKDRGIEGTRILASIAGEALPIQAGNSVREQAINRRVEMMLLDATGVPLSFEVVLPEGDTRKFVPPYPDRKLR